MKSASCIGWVCLVVCVLLMGRTAAAGDHSPTVKKASAVSEHSQDKAHTKDGHGDDHGEHHKKAAKKAKKLSQHGQEPEHQVSGRAHGRHQNDFRFLFGLKMSNAVVIGPVDSTDGVFGLFGGGAFFEVVLVPHLLEFELEVRVASAGPAIAVPMDLLLKVPFHLSSVVELYIGAGATFLIEVKDVEHEDHQIQHTGFGGGFVGVAGADLWFSTHWGLSLEATYSAVSLADSLFHEVGINTGVITRW